MRLVRWMVFIALLGVVGRVAVRTVSVESTDTAVRITIDKQKLRDARHDWHERGRIAVDQVGKALQGAGERLDDRPRR